MTRAEIIATLRRRTAQQRDCCLFLVSYYATYREPQARDWQRRADEQEEILRFLDSLKPNPR